MKTDHHFIELFVIDIFVAVFVKLFYEVFPFVQLYFFLGADGSAHDILQHDQWNLPSLFLIIVEVKKIKSISQVQVRNHDTDLVCLVQELLILNITIAIFVHFYHNLPEVLFQEAFYLHVLLEPCDDNVYWQLSITLLVHLNKNLKKLSCSPINTYFVIYIAGKCLFKFTFWVKKHKVYSCLRCDIFWFRTGPTILFKPLITPNFNQTQSFLRILVKHRSD